MQATTQCCCDGCNEEVPMTPVPTICANCRARLDALKAKRAATERKPEADRGKPGQLSFIPETRAEAAEHRRLMRKQSRAGAFG